MTQNVFCALCRQLGKILKKTTTGLGPPMFQNIVGIVDRPSSDVVTLNQAKFVV